jgi:beta-glucanase (GH16 family)
MKAYCNRHSLTAIFSSVLVSALLCVISALLSNAHPVALSSMLLNRTTPQLTSTLTFTMYLPAIFKNTWILIWHDEFDEPGGVSITNWIYDEGTSYPGGPSQWGTGEVEVMSSIDNVFQRDGYLHIQARHTGTDPLAGWTSGRIETVRTDFQPPANSAMAVEARIRLPNVTGTAAQGYWPAFWMLGTSYRGNYWNWPSVGEIDIMENINGLNQWWGVLHCGTNPGGPCNETTGLNGSTSGFSPTLQSEFHTYRLEFDKSVAPQQLRWYVDGIQHHIVYASRVDATTWNNATNHGFFIILNVAIGGGWPGKPTAATASGGTMLVDYVRVYTQS